MPVPPRTAEELDAIRPAGVAMRRNRSAFLARASKGQIGFAAMLHDRHAEVLGGIKVGRLVKAMPGWGPKRSQALLAELDIDPERRWRALGRNERAAITEALTA